MGIPLSWVHTMLMTLFHIHQSYSSHTTPSPLYRERERGKRKERALMKIDLRTNRYIYIEILETFTYPRHWVYIMTLMSVTAQKRYYTRNQSFEYRAYRHSPVKTNRSKIVVNRSFFKPPRCNVQWLTEIS